MNKEVKQYVEIFYPGLLVAESSIREVQERNPLKVVQQENATGFRYFEIPEVDLNGQVFTGERQNYSAMIYYGKRMSAEEVLAQNPGKVGLKSNIRAKGIKELAVCDNGTINALHNGDMTFAEVVQMLTGIYGEEKVQEVLAQSQAQQKAK